MKTNKKTGNVVGALAVHDNDEIMIITVGGQMVRPSVKGIRKPGRIAQGVQIVKLHESDRLQDIAPVITAEREDEVEKSKEGNEEETD